MPRPLEGRRVALAESRQLEELAQMLEKDGAVPLRYPLVGILDAPDETPVLEWLGELIADRFTYVVLMTGEALRRLMGFAERAGLRDEVITALSKTHTITRGPKPGRALREIGLTPTKVAEAPTTAGVIETLRKEPLQGQTVGITLYAEPNPPLVDFVESAGATARTVMPYVYAPAADAHRVVDLIHKMAAGDVDAIIFTSSAQSDRIFEVAKEHNLEYELRQGFDKTRVAAVGPIMAETLQDMKVRVDVCPEQGFVMKNLVTQLGRAMNK